MYPKGKDISLMAYTDADWAGCIDDRRSTSGVAFYLGECLVSWIRKKQSSVSLSTAEAKYIATTTCCTQVLWMKQTLTDIQVEYDEPIPIYCDNTSAMSISKNPVMHSKLSTFQSSITFYGNKLQKRTSELSMWAKKNKWQTSLQNHFHRNPMNIIAKDLELFLLQK